MEIPSTDFLIYRKEVDGGRLKTTAFSFGAPRFRGETINQTERVDIFVSSSYNSYLEVQEHADGGCKRVEE